MNFLQLITTVGQKETINFLSSSVAPGNVAHYHSGTKDIHLGNAVTNYENNVKKHIVYHELAHLVGDKFQSKTYLHATKGHPFFSGHSIVREELIAIEVAGRLSNHFNELDGDVINAIIECKAALSRLVQGFDGFAYRFGATDTFKDDVDRRFNFIISNYF